MSLFSERIRTRRRLWWAEPNKWRNRESYRHVLHRLKETHGLRHKEDPEPGWRCCEYWQRSLNNKWNAREFVQRYGCRVPQLYWSGLCSRAIPFDAVPAHFAIRLVWGAAHRNVYVLSNGYDLLRERTWSMAALRADIRHRQGWLPRIPILVEEFVTPESGGYVLPTEYKCYTFGTVVGAIQVVHRSGPQARHRFYTPEWEPFDDVMATNNPPADFSAPPRCLDELVATAKTLGAVYGTFVRVDLFASSPGCVFGEFSSTPFGGDHLTAFADRYFGELWDRIFPDRT